MLIYFNLLFHCLFGRGIRTFCASDLYVRDNLQNIRNRIVKVPNVFIANDNLIKLRLICLSDSDSFFSLAKKLIDYLVICITYFFGVLFVFYCPDFS